MVQRRLSFAKHRIERKVPIIRFILRAFLQENLSLMAAGVALFATLALVPGIAASVALYGLWADPAVISEHTDLLRGLVPPEAFGLVTQQLERILATTGEAHSIASLISIAVAIWSTRMGVNALVAGVCAAHPETRPRGFFMGTLIALLLTLALVGLLVVAMAMVVVVPAVLAFIELGILSTIAAQSARWGIMFFAIFFGISLLYRFGPNHSGAKKVSFFSYGAFVATLMWMSAAFLLSYYLANFGNYNKVYGSLAAIAALMMWFYVSAFVVLIGAGLNAARRAEEMEQEAKLILEGKT